MPVSEVEFQRSFCAEHLDEAEYLLQQRASLVERSFADRPHLQANDLRLLAHMQGLLLRADEAWAMLREALRRRPCGSLLQLGAWLALSRQDPSGVEDACAIVGAPLASRLAPAELVRWLPNEAHDWLLAQPVDAGQPEMIALQAQARAGQNAFLDWLTALPLESLLSGPHGEWLEVQLAQALIVSDQLPSRDRVRGLQAIECLSWACLVALMRHGCATPAAHERAWTIPPSHALAEPVLVAAASASRPEISLPRITNLFAGLRRREALWCSAASGAAGVLPHLLRHLRGPEAELARLGLFALLGVPEHLADESDPQVDSTIEDRAKALAADPGLEPRLLDGKARTDDVIVDAMKQGFQFQRILAWRVAPPAVRLRAYDPWRPTFTA